ncbi:3-dehydroshikimate dehydratase [Paramyrothecium foliicola]|nr:3-dehydroshikimate dehydratase [Paramyrothecium foliicola]
MSYKPSICSMSLGRSFAGHALPHKLEMAARYGFHGIELFYEDLYDFAKVLSSNDSPSDTQQLAAASIISKTCSSLGLTIICLQPFMHYEGLVSRSLHAKRIQDMELWLDLVHELGTDLVLLPSSNLPADQITEDTGLIVKDFQEVADMGLQRTPIVRFAFEALCWGTRVSTWEESWDVVQRVSRSNFGLCLDSFNIAGRIYADPKSPDGCLPDCTSAVTQSLKRLVSTVDVSRVFLVQMADGERLSRPLDESHPFYNAEQPARMSWSRNARLLYGETQYGAYLPVKAIMSSIIHGLGFKGWLSFEVFNRRLTESDAHVPEEMAQRGAQSWSKLIKDMGLEESYPARVQAML